MTEHVPAEPRVAGPQPAVPDWHRFDRWSSTFFLVLAAVTLIAVLTVGTVFAQDAGTGASAWPIGVAIATMALLVLASIALDRGAPWSRPAAVGVLLVIVATDAMRVVIDLTRSTITIPLAGLAALYLLSLRPGPLASLRGRDRRIATAVLGLFVLASLLSIALTVIGPMSTVS